MDTFDVLLSNWVASPVSSVWFAGTESLMSVVCAKIGTGMMFSVQVYVCVRETKPFAVAERRRTERRENMIRVGSC